MGRLSAGLGDAQAHAGAADHPCGFILDYISELYHRQLRHAGSNYGSLWEQWFDRPEGEWSTRDKRSIDRTFSGLAKLIFPQGVMEKEDARLLLELALELRLRVRQQLHVIEPHEFGLTEFHYVDRGTGEVCTASIVV